MKLIKKHPAALSVLFAASLLVPAVSVVHAVDQAEIEQKVSDTVSSGKSMASGINVEDVGSENLLNEAKDKAADIIGQGENATSDAQAKTEQQLESAKETTAEISAEPANDKLNALADSEEASAVEAQAEAAVEGDAQLEASTEEAGEPGLFDKLKSKVKELTSSDDAEAAKDETFVSDN